MRYDLSEKQIQEQIISFLQAKQFMWWRTNVGRAVYKNKDGSDRYVHYGTRGASDLFFLYKGTLFAVEVKTKKEYEYIKKHYLRIKSGQYKSKKDHHICEQINFIENIKMNGGVGLFCCDATTLNQFLLHYTKSD